MQYTVCMCVFVLMQEEGWATVATRLASVVAKYTEPHSLTCRRAQTQQIILSYSTTVSAQF